MPEVDEVLSLTGIAFATDRLMLPDEQIRPEPCATDRRHKFVKKSTPERLRLHLLKDFEPLPGLHYTLLFDELILNGQTGSEGILDHRISPRSRFGKLLVPSTSGRAISAVRVLL